LAIVSVIIWTHIIVYESTKINNTVITHPYLNTMLIGLESSNAGFLSASIFGGMLIYLLLCTLKGSFKCGLRIPFLFKLHPMKLNETFMNSFIFNVLLVLICSVSLTQFSVQIFSDYCRFTTINMFFGNQVTNLKFFKYFYQNNVFGYIFISISLLTLIYLCIFPSDKP
jgi:LMBR1 domain-containing protein 1